MLLNYLGKPSLQLPICMMIWGMMSVLTGMLTASSIHNAKYKLCNIGITKKYAP